MIRRGRGLVLLALVLGACRGEAHPAREAHGDADLARLVDSLRGPVERVWKAHHDASLVKRWLLGPDGWTMPVCDVARKVGDAYRFEWEADDGSQRFGFEGELLESAPPHRAVTTERMIGMEGPGSVNDMTLTAVGAGTLLTVLITYPSVEIRDMALGSGMVGGMEQSYARLEADVIAATPQA